MTIICTDGIKIVSDTQAENNGSICTGGAEKIIMRNGCIYALAGNLSLIDPVINWFTDGADPEKRPWKHVDERYQGFVFWAFKDGKLFEIVNSSPFPSECFPPDAIGSGREYALGALDFGASPEEAALIAMQRDTSSGGKLVSLELPEHLRLSPESGKSIPRIVA